MNCLDPITADLKVKDFVRVDSSLLDESVAAYDDEELPLRVVPVLALGDAWLTDVDAYLTAVESVDEFGERASIVNVHLERKGYLLLRKIAQICTVELLGERVFRNLRYHQCLRLVCKAVDHVHDLSESGLVGGRAVAVSV